jgi:hypothetical protein
MNIININSAKNKIKEVCLSLINEQAGRHIEFNPKNIPQKIDHPKCPVISNTLFL